MKTKNKFLILTSTALAISILVFVVTYSRGGGSKVIAEKSTNTTQTVDINQSSDNIKYYFSQANQEPDKALIDVINSSKKKLDISIYSLTKKEIVNAIIDSKNRGVDVRIITDKQEAVTKAESTELNLLRNTKIPIKINSHTGLMHLKVTVADNSTVTAGSYNYTEAATKDNDEVLMVISDSKIAQNFETQFERMWNNPKNFIDYK